MGEADRLYSMRMAINRALRTSRNFKAPASWLRPVVGERDELRFGKFKGLLVGQLSVTYRGAKYLLNLERNGWLILRDETRRYCLELVEDCDRHDIVDDRYYDSDSKRPDLLSTRRPPARRKRPTHWDRAVRSYDEVQDTSNDLNDDYDRFEAEYGYSREWF